MYPLITQYQDSIALENSNAKLSYQQLHAGVAQRVKWLATLAEGSVGLALDNGLEWVMMDLACQQAGRVCIPVPGFFSAAQRQHLLESAGTAVMVSDKTMDLPHYEESAFNGLFIYQSVSVTTVLMPSETGKVTFTSGSTGQPKGVCLSNDSQWQQAQVLADSIDLQSPRHLCLLPLATLLENIAGVYAPLIKEGTVCLPTDEERGFCGSHLSSPDAMFHCISQYQPDSLILVPELLRVLLAGIASGWQPPESLRFIAVGGGHVSEQLLQQAMAAGLPVYQGYGLSECCSVVTLNRPNHNMPGSVGTLLTGRKLRLEDGELCVQGNLFLGYLGEPDSWYPEEVRTGDLMRCDDSHWYIEGRKKNLIINTFGRNISPEWIEAELQAQPLIYQSVIVGEGQPYLSALILPMKDVGDEAIEKMLAQVNQQLPDYAQVLAWHRLAEPLTFEKGLLTSNYRLKRPAIAREFKHQIEQLYVTHPNSLRSQYDEAI